MKKETICTGYLRVNNYYSFYDKDFALNVHAEFNYIDRVTQDCYDKNGGYLGNYISEKRYSKEETKIKEGNYKRVIQIGYDFKLVSSDYSLNADEINDFAKVLNKSCIGKFYVDWSLSDNERDKDERIKEAELIEITSIGSSRQIQKYVGKSFFNLDLKKYKKNLDTFIKNNDEYYSHSAKYLYDINIMNLCDYFMCTEKQLFNSDKTPFLIRRLNYKINNKKTKL